LREDFHAIVEEMRQMTGQATASTRWWILVFLSLLVFGNYYVFDSIGPIAAMLSSELGFTDTQIGTLNGIYSLPNIFLLLIGGVIVDRLGAPLVIMVTALMCFVGASITAMSGDFTTMVAGRLIYGLGAEVMLVAATVAIAMWFGGTGGVAFAMALNLSVARAGSYAADLSPLWARPLYEQGWQLPLVLAAAIAGTGLLFALLYRLTEKRGGPPPMAGAGEPETFEWRNVARFGRSFWYLLGLCVLFYSVIFPFRSTFSIKYFQHAHDLPLQAAAVLNSYVYLAALICSPLIGWLADRYGRRSFAMMVGSLLLPLSFLGLFGYGWGLEFTMLMLGVSFSLIPAIMWPSVIKLTNSDKLGTAYGLLFMIQNAGMMTANVTAGWLNDTNGAGADNPAGYVPMLVFFLVLASLAAMFAFALWRREQGPHTHGLEIADRPKTIVTGS
jgi:MFS family permease